MMSYKYIILLLFFALFGGNSCISSNYTATPQDLSDYSSDALSAESDVQNLLKAGFQKAGKSYNTVRFQISFDKNLKDSIKIRTTGAALISVQLGDKNNSDVALYSYLDLLGFRFYGSTDLWTFIPALYQLPKIDTTISSYFQFRGLTPSYGAGSQSIPALQNTIALYQRWMNRLRMANLMNVPSGHYGSTFNKKYQTLIEANPSWRGKDANGKIRPWSLGLKLCYSNSGVVDLYKKDALQRLKDLQKNSSPPYFINMEPPDGTDFCMCQNCGSPSEQVFGLANEVAELLQKVSTDAYVSLYGYNQHAQPPTFPLKKNILVGIAPFNYQGFGSSEKLMQQWEEKGVRLYLRDYLAIPVSNEDKPTYNPHENLVLDKMVHLRDKNYLGYRFETTTSFMAVGLQFYLISEASWKNVNGLEEYDEFLSKMFPGYEQAVSLIYENLPNLNESNFQDALDKVDKLIGEATKEGNTDIVSRCRDIQFYIQYLFLQDAYQKDKSPSNLDALLNKIMTEPASRLLHPYGLYRVLQRTNANLPAFKRTVDKQFDLPKTNLSDRTSLQRISLPNYQAVNKDFYLPSVADFESLRFRNKKGIVWIGNNYGGNMAMEVKATLLKGRSEGKGIIIIRKLGGEYVTETDIPADSQFKQYQWTLPSNQFYEITFSSPSTELEIKGPNRPFAFTDQLDHAYLYKEVPFFFKIPDSQNEAIIRIPEKAGQVVVKHGNTILLNKKQNESFDFSIKNLAGEIIELDMYREGVQLLNIPYLISLHKDAVIYEK